MIYPSQLPQDDDEDKQSLSQEITVPVDTIDLKMMGQDIPFIGTARITGRKEGNVMVAISDLDFGQDQTMDGAMDRAINAPDEGQQDTNG